MKEALKRQMEQMVVFRRPMAPNHARFCCMEEFLLTQGRFYDPPPTDPQLELGTPKQCFANASHLALNHPHQYRYVEGLILLPDLPIPIHHAWIVNDEDQALDPTLAWDVGAAFIGLAFEPEDFRTRLIAQRIYGLFDDGIGYTPIVTGADRTFKYKRKAA